jgi:hypothetical protein
VRGGELRVGAPLEALKYDRKGKPIRTRKLPQIHPDHYIVLKVPKGESQELYATLPPSIGARAGRPVSLVVFADAQVGVESIAVVPLSDELPPPAPKPWKPGD